LRAKTERAQTESPVLPSGLIVRTVSMHLASVTRWHSEKEALVCSKNESSLNTADLAPTFCHAAIRSRVNRATQIVAMNADWCIASVLLLWRRDADELEIEQKRLVHQIVL
jgi:hypothetical protein